MLKKAVLPNGLRVISDAMGKSRTVSLGFWTAVGARHEEEAQEEVEADTRVEGVTIGFNVTYLLEALSSLRDEKVVLALRDANSSALVREASNERCRHVVMPLRL